MMVLDQGTAVTGFAFAVCLISLITIIVLLFLEIISEFRILTIIAYEIMGVIVLSWFCVGFLLILIGIPIETPVYFRPMIPILVSMFTGSMVFVYAKKSSDKTISMLRETIIELRSKIKEYESEVIKN